MTYPIVACGRHTEGETSATGYDEQSAIRRWWVPGARLVPVPYCPGPPFGGCRLARSAAPGGCGLWGGWWIQPSAVR